MTGYEYGDKNQHVRSSAVIVESLLRRAFREGRGPEMARTIRGILMRVRNMPDGHDKGLALARAWEGEARGVRMLNLLAMEEGVPTVFTDASKDPEAGEPASPKLN